MPMIAREFPLPRLLSKPPSQSTMIPRNKDQPSKITRDKCGKPQRGTYRMWGFGIKMPQHGETPPSSPKSRIKSLFEDLDTYHKNYFHTLILTSTQELIGDQLTKISSNILDHSTKNNIVSLGWVHCSTPDLYLVRQ